MKLFISIIFLGALIGLGAMIGRSTPTPLASPQLENGTLPTTPQAEGVPSEAKSTPPAGSPVAQGGGAPTGRLVVSLKEGEVTQVKTVDVVSKQQKVIFTDKGNARKIQSLSNISPDGDTFLAVMSSEGDLAGQLVSVKADGSGQATLLIDNFVTTGAPALSPDQTKIASVSFANTEADFGFSLVIQNVDGSNRRAVAKHEGGIGRPVFSPDGTKIAFIAGSPTSAESVNVVDLGTGKESQLYKAAGRTIQDFSWNRTGLLVVVTAPTTDPTGQSTDVFLADRQNNSSVQITKDEKTEHMGYLAPDASGVAYIEVVTNRVQSGELVVTLPNGTSLARLGKANQILGWIR